MLSLHRLLGHAVRAMVGHAAPERFAVIECLARGMPENLICIGLNSHELMSKVGVWMPSLHAALGDDLALLVSSIEDSEKSHGRAMVVLITAALAFHCFLGRQWVSLDYLSQTAIALAARFLHPNDPLSLATSAVCSVVRIFPCWRRKSGQEMFRTELERHMQHMDPSLSLTCFEARALYATVLLWLPSRYVEADRMHAGLVAEARARNSPLLEFHCLRIHLWHCESMGNMKDAFVLSGINQDTFLVLGTEMEIMEKLESCLRVQLMGDPVEIQTALPWRDQAVRLIQQMASDFATSPTFALTGFTCTFEFLSTMWLFGLIGNAGGGGGGG